jgi:hypothetical protein
MPNINYVRSLTRHILVQGWYCLRSYSTRSFFFPIGYSYRHYDRGTQWWAPYIPIQHWFLNLLTLDSLVKINARKTPKETWNCLRTHYGFLALNHFGVGAVWGGRGGGCVCVWVMNGMGTRGPPPLLSFRLSARDFVGIWWQKQIISCH